MSEIHIPGFNPNSSQPRLAAVLGDVLDLTPSDERFVYDYSVISAPGGSTATFSDATFTPDVVGSYVFEVSAGSAVLVVPLFVFASSVYSGIAHDQTGRPRGDAERRQILKGAANVVTLANLAAWNSGTFPPGLDSRFTALGG